MATLTLLLTAIGLSPDGSGYYACTSCDKYEDRMEHMYTVNAQSVDSFNVI
jgi:hypothetical protein